MAAARAAAQTFGADRGLFPPPALERGEAVQWLVWANVAYPGMPGIEPARRPAIAEWAKTCASRPGYAVAMAP